MELQKIGDAPIQYAIDDVSERAADDHAVGDGLPHRCPLQMTKKEDEDGERKEGRDESDHGQIAENAADHAPVLIVHEPEKDAVLKRGPGFDVEPHQGLGELIEGEDSYQGGYDPLQL